MKRIVGQYQDAIKDFQAKRPVDFDELPTPPGFGPIPTGTVFIRKNDEGCEKLFWKLIGSTDIFQIEEPQ